ncbi:hypothetical protein SAMN05216403_102102 [Nitrosospira multiformis ATCC 25196]|uniref:Uncharacterized protein n=1 Tax=Nitrosospira multiformis (strain ATCC 25196 / NCIMB 11849 / C 71) TaxID=323848 RepID=A0A1H5SCR8_NITMU|nr:hypothetical protein [Nitrosospira multiformis]SEF48285.1 hypothetical protein SAMN05216403_102102 [Nitrosospira multiformis ATCC 25196]
MDDFVEVPQGKRLLQLLEEKHQLPVTIAKYTCCASCHKPFTPLFQPAAELHVAPDGLRLPILHLCQLCQGCAAKHRRGGRRQRAVLAAVREFLAKEVS